MREQEMRMRVFRFLKARMRNMIMPATVGIGLAVGACAKEAPVPLYGAAMQDSGQPANTDGRVADEPTGPDLAVAERDAQLLPDEPADLARDIPSDDVSVNADGVGSDLRKLDAVDSSAPDVAVPPDEAVALDGAGIDLGKDLGSITTKYIAPQPDAAADSGSAVAMYTAQMPDAGVLRDGLAVRYMAQTPDA